MNQTRKSKKRIKKRVERPPLKSYWIEWREEEESERTDGESTSQEEKEEEKEEKKGEIFAKLKKVERRTTYNRVRSHDTFP